MSEQPITSQMGEIEFRRKLYQQQVEGEAIFSDEFDADGIEKLLFDRMKETFDQMISLRKDRVILSPYIEIGAERCQRSLVMENDLGATGAAVDISFDMLKSCDHYRVVFDRGKVPLRVCCDANHLPFMRDSVPFVFCYATLHHFPDPGPVVRDIHRVLSPGGCFFFGGESYKRILHANLCTGKSYAASRRSGKLRKAFDYFFADDRGGSEVEHGIIENNDIPIRHWRQVLAVFEESQVELQSFKYIKSGWSRPSIDFFLAYLLGGLISGTCHKAGVIGDKGEVPIRECLICPSCLETGYESTLAQNDLGFFCGRCGEKFPIVDDIVLLFSRCKVEQLYPEIIEGANSSN